MAPTPSPRRSIESLKARRLASGRNCIETTCTGGASPPSPWPPPPPRGRSPSPHPPRPRRSPRRTTFPIPASSPWRWTPPTSARGVFTVHETIPVSSAGPGPITLLYPRWLPGNHSPSGPIDKLAGLKITAGGAAESWRRDPVDVYAFHVEAPAGVTALDVDFQFLSAVSTREGRVMMTPQMLSLEWNTVALYPAGYFSRRIMVAPSVRLPAGFTAATALETPLEQAGA